MILFCGHPATGSAQSTVTPAKTSGPVASGKDNYAFLSANRVQSVVDLQKAGYVEEEFLVSGTANVYDWLSDGSLKIKTANAPYNTRILIRRPALRFFSGNVILEPFENNRSFDWAFLGPPTNTSWTTAMPGSGDSEPEAIAALRNSTRHVTPPCRWRIRP
jgi:hypothetical protein